MFKLLFSTIFLTITLAISGASFSPQVIKIYDEEELSRLEEDGVNILRRRGDILLCLVPTDNDHEIVIPNSLRKVTPPTSPKGKTLPDFSRGFNTPTLDIATSYYDASDILNGKGFNQPLTGEGIVVGICDIGFDPLHPTFLDTDGKSRVKRVTQYIEREGIRIQLEGDEQYKEWGTDDPDNYHATHVCGILAGNGAGTPYAGIARNADIVVSTSTLSDVGLLAGVEDIIDYAKETGKPAVINLSMGNYTGAHDGTSLFSQYLDMCAEDAIIVLSAGNEGIHTNYLSYTFSEQKDNVSFRLGNTKWTQFEMYGITDIWGYDNSPLTLEISIYDDGEHKLLYTYPPFTLDNYDVEQIIWAPSNPVIEGCALNGYMLITQGVDPENNRRQAMLMYDFDSPEKTEGGWAKYVISVKVSGIPDNSVDIFADGTYTRLMDLSGNPTPNSRFSISDLACGNRVISVGMYGNRASIPVSVKDAATGEWIINEEETGIEPMSTVLPSSYGSLHDGRVLPLTVAPGNILVSSLSRPYLESHSERECLRLDAPWLAEGGTSMASPYVAGFIATWLEAYPNLTPEDVIRIISATNRTDIADMNDPHNANGWFDPLGALMLIEHEAGIEEIETEITEGPDRPEKIVTISGLPASSTQKTNSLHKKAKGTKIIL
ncbi:MAG: S8 family serine peptidase [Bacteroides sp.]|nr:S8 family serine peptidase [Bacteroides sp.]